MIVRKLSYRSIFRNVIALLLLFTSPVFAQTPPPPDTIESLKAQLAPLLAGRPARIAEAAKLTKEKNAVEADGIEAKKSFDKVAALVDDFNARSAVHNKAIEDHNANRCQTTPSNPCAEYNAESGRLNERTAALGVEHDRLQAMIDANEVLKAALLKRNAAYDVARLEFNDRNEKVEAQITAIQKKIADLTPKVIAMVRA